jgi:hypothetical protein
MVRLINYERFSMSSCTNRLERYTNGSQYFRREEGPSRGAKSKQMDNIDRIWFVFGLDLTSVVDLEVCLVLD